MISALISLPVLGFTALFQSAVISRVSVSAGAADLVLVLLVALSLQKTVPVTWVWGVVGGLLVDSLSGLPFGIFTISYLAAVGAAGVIRQRIWRFSFLMQLLVVFMGTLISHSLAVATLFLQGGAPGVMDSLRLVTLPSLMLNFLLSIPVFILVQDIVEQLQPIESQ